ncbi:hypothetical protein HAX54_018560 [Datura stramonium]|uniref:Uncharacterized protein n=1 Tax=Datura stramonium TaxID=4076 RepID=A0ABS8S1F8_DATST|nr:hypothetical protein [Datura stramonium]
MSTHRRRITLSNVTVKLGCSSSSCIRPKPRFFTQTLSQENPQSKTQNKNYSNYSSCSSWDTTTTTFSPHSDSTMNESSDFRTSRAVQGSDGSAARVLPSRKIPTTLEFSVLPWDYCESFY